MNVRIVTFPTIRVGAVEHRGPPQLEHESVRRLIEWRIEQRLPPHRHRTFGIHYDDPRTTPAAAYRADFCVEVEGDVAPNRQGVIAKLIPGGRCAVARHVGSRDHVAAAEHLAAVWLPASGEALRDFPMFFHYVNVGPDIRDDDMVTDVYLPLR